MKLEKEHICHGGKLGYYSHDSSETGTEMRFSLFVPSNVQGAVPYVVFLSGLTCTEDNFTTKAHAYEAAAALGLAVLAPDTSPRGEGVSDDEAYDLGQGAGFYLDATQERWATNFRMESYIMRELLPLVEKEWALILRGNRLSGIRWAATGRLHFIIVIRRSLNLALLLHRLLRQAKCHGGKRLFGHIWVMMKYCGLSMMRAHWYRARMLRIRMLRF